MTEEAADQATLAPTHAETAPHEHEASPADAPRADAPRADAPRADAPRADAPRDAIAEAVAEPSPTEVPAPAAEPTTPARTPVEAPPSPETPPDAPPAKEPNELPPAKEPPIEPAPPEVPTESSPAKGPVIETPVPEAPPAEEPPIKEPPNEEPPIEEPPAKEPPIEEPPAKEPAIEPPPEPLHVAPVIETVKPDHGPLAGGTTVAITGEGFLEGCVVLVGGVEASVTRDSATSLHILTPARDQKGFVEVRVVNPGDTYGLYEEDYRYDAAPTISGVAPPCVTTDGGSVLTILGADFTQGCAVRIGGELMPCSWANAGRLEAVTKRHDAGVVEIAVENPDGQRAVREGGVVFAAPPRIDAVVPASISTAGGVDIRIVGKAFEPGSAVLLGDEPIEGTLVGAGEIRFVAPARKAAGAVDVSVVGPSGLTHRVPNALTFVKEPPLVEGVSPDTGPSAGGTPLTLRGRGFDPEITAVVCGVEARVAWKSATELVVTTPEVARDGLVDVRVVNVDGQAHVIERAFRYVAATPPPRLLQVGTPSGAQAGGLEVALLGEDFVDGCKARFAGVEASVRFLTHKELRATTPAYVGYGEVTVEVVNPDGASSALADSFTYEPTVGPEISGLTPANGPTTGGTRVVLEGKNFTRDVAVYVGRERPKDQAVKSATEIVIVTAPRKQAGVVDVEVVPPGAPRAVAKNGFRYDAVPAPTISSVSPSAGTPAGGTEMTISGKSFTKETVVLIDGKSPKTVKLVDASILELKTPPGEAGKMVDVVVRNADGKEAIQKRAFLYDPRYRG